MASKWTCAVVLALALGGCPGAAQLLRGGSNGMLQDSSSSSAEHRGRALIAPRGSGEAAAAGSSTLGEGAVIKDALEAMLDQGEVAKKSKKADKKILKSGPELAAKEKKKAMGEKDVKVDVTKIEVAPGSAESENLGSGEEEAGKVTQVLDEAKVDSKAEKAARQKERREGMNKAKVSGDETAQRLGSHHTRKHDVYEDDDEMSHPPKKEKMLKLHTCEKVDDRVAFLVPTAGVMLERTAALVISFDRMGYSHDMGDLKLVFSNHEALEKFEKQMPKFLREFDADDVPYHRLMVEIKENAIVLNGRETLDAELQGIARQRRLQQLGGTPGAFDWETQHEQDLRAFQARERLLALAHVLDTQPCNYKYAVLTPPEGRFVKPAELKRKDTLAAIRGALTPHGKTPGASKIAAAGSKGKKKNAAAKPKKGLETIEMMNGKSISSIEKEHGGESMFAEPTKKPKKAKKTKKFLGIFRGRSLLAAEKEEEEEEEKSGFRGGGGAAERGSRPARRTAEVAPKGRGGAARPISARAKAVAHAARAAKQEANGSPLAPLNVKFDLGTLWAQKCADVQVTPEAKAVSMRMEANALLFSGQSTKSPRYTRLYRTFEGFSLFTLQGDLSLIHLKHDGAKFLLELFRASLAAPAQPPTTLRELVDATFEKYPAEVMPLLSDVLLLQYYHVLRNGYHVESPVALVPTMLPGCGESPSLLGAGGMLTHKVDRLKFSHTVKPLLVSEAFPDADSVAIMKVDPALLDPAQTNPIGPY